ncbi:MAG: protein kinase domain-containing protein, partial [bacterium]
IFLANDPTAPGRQRVKVLDFGIAKLSNQEAGLGLTLVGTVMGSPAYMSPEQARSADGVNARSDQYSLGCVLFHMLSGKPPFESDTTIETMMAHLRDVPPALGSLAPVSKALERIVDRLLAKQPADRFASMEHVSRALSAIAGRTTVGAVPLDTLLDFPVEESEDEWVDESPEPPVAATQSLEPVATAATAGTDGPSATTQSLDPVTTAGADRYPVPMWARASGASPELRSSTLPISEQAAALSGHAAATTRTGSSAMAMHSPGAGPDVPFGALVAALPDRLRVDAIVIHAFLQILAESYQLIDDSTVRLIRPLVPGAAGFEFFALLMRGVESEQIHTATFIAHALPLERHLQSLRSDTKKVVIVVSDWFELGRGVREKILDYRTRFDAFVVPIYLGEMRKAHREKRLDTLFTERLADFQAVPDLYATSGAPGDPTRFFGMRHVLDDLLAELEVAQRVVVIHGLPGSGKSSLARMADYGMTTTRFVHVECSGVAPPALAGRIAGALGRPGDGLEALRAAAQAAVPNGGGPRVVLVLDDAELVTVPGDADAWLTAGVDPIDPSVRALLDALIELARDQVMTTVAITVRGYALGRAIRNGERNPLAKVIRTLHVPPLERRAVIQMIRDLGAQMNVTASDR